MFPLTYLFTTADERREMLDTIGVESVDALFETVPAELRLDRPLDVPPALTEMELESLVTERAGRTKGVSSQTCFLGGGAYDHFVPAVVDEIAGRGEFYTAYTPYQAEASQGSLQVFFEFQSLICELTGMEVANASLYEGGTAVSEAVFLAVRATRRHGKIVLLGSVHPEYRQVVDAYAGHLETEIVTVDCPDGVADPEAVRAVVDDTTACVVVQHPNFLGCLEDVESICQIARDAGAVSIVSVDPISLGVLRRPGDYGADVVVAEGQPLGVPLQYGGPYLGLMACRTEFMRKMPGRLIGETVDREGRHCYVLNLQAREQHIRRDKATSNICTNQGLIALRATVYLTSLGPHGIREAAELCTRKAHYAADKLGAVDGLSVAYDKPFFKEFTVRSERPVGEVVAAARAAGFGIGPELAPLGGPENTFLVAVTEKRTKDEIDRLATALA